MIPCLYEQAETAFVTNGIGKLCDAMSCTVVEKRNGSYELKMTYPADGIHAQDVTEGALVLAKPSEKASAQPFRIYKIMTPLTGILEIAARHIQYQENFITVSPFTAIGSQAAMAELKKRATTDCPFSFWTDIESQAAFAFTSPATIRSCLGGMDGSLLDTYGGEYEWDMYTTMLHGHRGSDNGVRIVYGKNLIDFQMEKSIENVITGVHPYWKHSEDGTLMELPEKVVTVMLGRCSAAIASSTMARRSSGVNRGPLPGLWAMARVMRSNNRAARPRTRLPNRASRGPRKAVAMIREMTRPPSPLRFGMSSS